MTKNLFPYYEEFVEEFAQKTPISHTGNYNFDFENLIDDEDKAEFYFF